MNPATGHFASAAAIALALQARLKLVPLPDNSGLAFQRVELFYGKDYHEAFSVLLLSEQRLALVVPLPAMWETAVKVRKILVRRVQHMAILISDRVIGSRPDAIYGGAANPGAYALVAAAVPHVTGQLISNPGGVISTPAEESLWNASDSDKRDLPGRAGVVLELQCQGGWLEAPLDAGPSL